MPSRKVIPAVALVACAATLVLGVSMRARAVDSPRLHVPRGFTIDAVAHVARARELAAAPNGDLIVGTGGRDVAIVPDAEGTPGAPHRFATLPDGPAAGVAFAPGTLYIGSQFGIWRVPYRPGDASAASPPVRIASVRPSGISRDHVTTSVAYADGHLYASVGSSCDACDPELDATRATVQEMAPDGSGMHPRAERIRNAVALTANPHTGAVWALPNGQDALAHGHPYEIGDPVTAHAGVPNYGWPHCYEDRRKVEAGADCSTVVVPRLIMPAYDAPIGAAVYPERERGDYAFPSSYAGGLFVALHGSWHTPLVAPRVVFVPLDGDRPKTPPDWNDPTTQWREFVGGYQSESGDRAGRPTGIAVGSKGSLFVADDDAGVIYRIRPAK